MTNANLSANTFTLSGRQRHRVRTTKTYKTINRRMSFIRSSRYDSNKRRRSRRRHKTRTKRHRVSRLTCEADAIRENNFMGKFVSINRNNRMSSRMMTRTRPSYRRRQTRRRTPSVNRR